MNVWGKVFAFMVVIAGVASMALTSKFINTRNSWAAKIAPFAKTYATDMANLKTTTDQRNTILHELELMNREWGTDFRAGGGRATQPLAPAEGRLEVALGSGSGLVEKQLLHGFELKADGTSVYRGPFTVFGPPQAERAAVTPAWRIRPGEPTEWQPGQWRWRSSIPSGYSQHFDEVMLNFTKSDETMADRKAGLVTQDRLIAEATMALQRRQAELLGGEELAKEENVSPEFRLGLVSTLEATEEERNSVLLEIDALRRKVRAARDAVVKMQQENLALVQKLPAGPSDAKY